MFCKFDLLVMVNSHEPKHATLYSVGDIGDTVRVFRVNLGQLEYRSKFAQTDDAHNTGSGGGIQFDLEYALTLSVHSEKHRALAGEWPYRVLQIRT